LSAALVIGPTVAHAQQTPGQIVKFASDTSLTNSAITEDPNSLNVGVGTTNPLGQLHVKGDNPVRILGDVSTLSGSESVDFMARNSQYGSDIGGMRIQRDPFSGDVNTLFLAAPFGNLPFERMRVGGNGNVGIGTTSPTNILTVGQGGGNVLADGYDTYSSRRWKTNIYPLTDALAKITQLQGVSFDRTANGKRDIGFLAEDVGQVVPEIVTYEPNGNDARSVDYSRLTPLLVEAVKEQQAEIQMLRDQLKNLMSLRAR
jgi:hypothetical protein